ncbi:hypothetical protein ACGFIG_15810 [Micromonospora sp. NPDC049048]|uniref:hypothetical protein n=1 Tax=Micromonospora sp. NPDC049048 TaxID=3364263 RepID=UPI00371B0D16
MSREAHLQMVQSVISRLSAHSMTIKGWCVTVTAGLLAAGSATPASAFAPLVAFYVVLAFAVLDAYYLSLERAYRLLYGQVVANQTSEWSLDVPRPATRSVASALLSPAIAILYGMSACASALAAAYLLMR